MRRYTLFAAVFSLLFVVMLVQSPQKAQADYPGCQVFNDCNDGGPGPLGPKRCKISFSPSSITAGQSTTLKWDAGGKRLSLLGFLGSYSTTNELKNLPYYRSFVIENRGTGSITVGPGDPLYPTLTTTYRGKAAYEQAFDPQPCLATLSVVLPLPTLTITADPMTVAVSATSIISATFTAGVGDTLTRTAINDDANELWCGTNCAPTSALWTAAPIGAKSYGFTPTKPGAYIFYPSALTAGYPDPWSNYGQSVTVTAVCGAGSHQSGSSCDSDTRTCTPKNAPKNSGTQTWNPITKKWGACVAASCNANYHLEGTVCVKDAPDVCSNLSGTQASWPIPSGTGSKNGNTCTCTGPSYVLDDGSGSWSCIANVVPPPPPLPALDFNATRVRSNESSQLSWNITGSLGGITCTISGTPPVASPSVSTNTGSTPTPPITQSIVYTLSCTNGATTISDSATAGLLPGYQ